MELIIEHDYKDYIETGTIGFRPSVRAIIIRGNNLAMVYSEKLKHYLFAGGGIDEGETMEEALVREVREELGLEVIPETISEYGLIVRKEKGKKDDLFIQENYFFICDVKDEVGAQQLDIYEAEEEYVLKWVTPEEVLDTNLNYNHTEQENVPYRKRLMERQNWLVERLISEGRFG